MTTVRLQPILLILLAILSAWAGAKPSGSPSGSDVGGKKRLLLISFDGFRWDYDQDVDTPNLDQLAWDGVKAKYITPPMLTMTSPSHFTTITGSWTHSR